MTTLSKRLFCSKCVGSHPLPCFFHPNDLGVELSVITSEDKCNCVGVPHMPGCNVFQPGYHLRPITRGVYGESSKVVEELDEYEESLEQGNKIMAMVELSDAYGALEALAGKHNLTMNDLAKMSAATKRAFQSGARRSKDE